MNERPRPSSHAPSRPLVLIYADESCLGNQFRDRENPGGAGGLVEFWTGDGWVRRDYWVSEPATTNNRMALRSAIEGLRALTQPCRVGFVSDSQYVVKGMREWLPVWKARGWKRKGGPIENLKLWKDLDLAADTHQMRWEWVRGHSGMPRNEYANHLAVEAARSQEPSNGLVDSRFEEWLDAERAKSGRYLDFEESAPPPPPF